MGGYVDREVAERARISAAVGSAAAAVAAGGVSLALQLPGNVQLRLKRAKRIKQSGAPATSRG